jgi:adenylate cyclase
MQPTNNMEAFDYWLRGFVEEFSVPTKEGFVKSRQWFEQAIALDPNYADAYAALAYNYIMAALQQYDKVPQAQRAVELAQRAIALDDSNWVAYLALGMHYGFQRQYERAIGYDQHAIALDPNNPIIYFQFGSVLGMAGQPAEVIRVEEQATRLDPRNADLYAIEIGWAYGLMGQYARGLPFLQRHAKRYPDNILVHTNLAITYAQLGRLAEARAEAAEIVRLNPQYSLLPLHSRDWCALKDEAICQRDVAALRLAGLK